MAKKIKKAILAGLTAYAASKMLGKGKLTAEQAAAVENANIPKKKSYAHELEKYISSKKPEHLGDTGKSMNDLLCLVEKIMERLYTMASRRRTVLKLPFGKNTVVRLELNTLEWAK